MVVIADADSPSAAGHFAHASSSAAGDARGPCARGGAAACVLGAPVGGGGGEVGKRRLFVYGGASRDPEVWGDAWMADVDVDEGALAWRRLAPGAAGAPPPRSGATACAVDAAVYVFGGQDPATGMVFNDVHSYDADADAWEAVPPAGTSPPPMHSHACVVLRDRLLVVFGGASPNGCHADVYVFDTETRQWTKPAVKCADGVSAPAAREMHTGTAVDANTLVVYGGRGADGGVLDDAAVLDASDGSCFVWTRHKRTGKARCAHAAAAVRVADGAPTLDVLVHGGFSGTEVLASPQVLDAASLTWRASSAAASPSPASSGPRFAHAGAHSPDGRFAAFFGGVTADSDLGDAVVWVASPP